MAVKGLEYVIKLSDKMSSPLGKVSSRLNEFSHKAKQSMANIGVGAAGLFAVGASMKAALMPAIEMDRALGEVKSLGVVDEQLKQLNKTALVFSVNYGKSASEFVSASYDIQSAISGLVGNELSEFTRASAVLATATKSNTGTITSYVGTMYGIFEKTATKMGKAEWVNMLGGQTAKAVQMFKTTGDQMSAAFTSLGASAQSVGVGMTEQMAILGSLQATMSGSEAGTKYRAFLSGIGKAQDKLNLKFTDSQGQMLPIVDILNKIKGKYGETISVAESDELSKAFGTQEAVAMVKLLMNKTEGLKGSIETLGKVKGLGAAEKMAKSMIDPWQRLSATISAVSSAIGSTILPILYPVLNTIADIGSRFVAWLSTYKNIARWIGYVFFGLMAFTAIGPVFLMLKGVFTLWSASMFFAKKTMKMLYVQTKLQVVMQKVLSAVMIGFNVVMKIVAVGARIMWAAFTGPIGLVIAVIGAIATAVYLNWDKIKGYFSGLIDSVVSMWNGLTSFISNGWKFVFNFFKEYTILKLFEKLVEAIPGIWNSFTETLKNGWNVALAFFEEFSISKIFTNLLNVVPKIWDNLIENIMLGWNMVLAFFQQFSLIKVFSTLGETVGNIFGNIFTSLKQTFFDFLNWFINKANSVGKYVGLEIPTLKVEKVSEQATAQSTVSTDMALPTSTQASSLAPVKQGLISSKTTSSSHTDNSLNIQNVTIKAEDPKEFMRKMREQQQLAAG